LLRDSEGLFAREIAERLGRSEYAVRRMRARLGLTDAPFNAERFWSLVEKTEYCWLWLGPLDRFGYGLFDHRGQGRAAHRLSYEQKHGPLQSSIEIHHTCRVRRCIRPTHLEPVAGTDHTRVNHPTYDPMTRCKRLIMRLTVAERMELIAFLDAVEAR